MIGEMLAEVRGQGRGERETITGWTPHSKPKTASWVPGQLLCAVWGPSPRALPLFLQPWAPGCFETWSQHFSVSNSWRGTVGGVA